MITIGSGLFETRQTEDIVVVGQLSTFFFKLISRFKSQFSASMLHATYYFNFLCRCRQPIIISNTPNNLVEEESAEKKR